MSIELLARIRGGASNNLPGPVRANRNGELLFQAAELPYVEASRRGGGWQVMDTTATAAVVVRPSTTAGLTLWNGEQPGGKSYVIDRVFVFNLVSTAALSDFSAWACVHPIGMTKPTADITAIKSLSGRSGNYGGNAIVDTAAAVNDDGWFPISNVANVIHGVGTTPSHALAIPIEGRIIVPPSAAVSVNVVASITGLTFTHGFAWYEVQLDNE